MHFPVKRGRRRLAALSVALAAVGAGLALTTSPAHASAPQICLDANAQQVQNYGAIIQFGCSYDDAYQQWTPVKVGHTANGILVRLESVGAVDSQGHQYCLDADAQETYNYGAVIQFQCNSADPFQVWDMYKVSHGHFMIQSWGALRNGQTQFMGARHNGATVCLDADAQNVGNYGSIIQFNCNSSDPFQQWTRAVNLQGNYILESVGA
jgi:cell wall assembly regulator SMI1